MFTNPSDDELRALLLRTTRIAVVGLSPKAHRDSYRVSKQMQEWGFDIVPVRPLIDKILGEPAFGSLEAVPSPVDLVNVFRKASEIDAVVDSAIAIKAPAIWIQMGIINEAAALRAQAAGLVTVMDRCILVEYARLGLA